MHWWANEPTGDVFLIPCCQRGVCQREVASAADVAVADCNDGEGGGRRGGVVTVHFMHPAAFA
jgi:hypothetical protein